MDRYLPAHLWCVCGGSVRVVRCASRSGLTHDGVQGFDSSDGLWASAREQNMNEINVNEIEEVKIHDTAIGIRREVTTDEVKHYIGLGKYYIDDVGVDGYKVVVYDQDDFKILATVLTETDKEPETEFIRGGGKL